MALVDERRHLVGRAAEWIDLQTFEKFARLGRLQGLGNYFGQSLRYGLEGTRRCGYGRSLDQSGTD